ncbi:MAG: hypothetical protein U9Q91_08170 [Candidatus Marinimicrobia bacterium]|nr:hypothetical protein [Candidatus Neomarinimicrobiota bacterium]
MSRDILWDYFDGKQSLKQLQKKYQISIKTIRSKIDEYEISFPLIPPSETIIIMDTTYFRRGFGVMVFFDHWGCKYALRYYVKTETVHLYRQGINILKLRGWEIKGIVCDGRRGLFKAFPGIPMQMCHFHQQTIIRRYLTQYPKVEASKELRKISLTLSSIDEESWVYVLDEWYKKWKEFLKEKTTNLETGKWHYTHKRLRSAYRSLKTNTPYLFTYQKYPKLNMPNTTNPLEGRFTDLKNKLRNHPGIKDNIKIKLTDHYLSK